MFLEALSAAGYTVSTPSRSRTGEGDDDWQRAWADLHITHVALMRVLDDLEAPAFDRNLTDRDGNGESVYTWARGCLLHDRLHAAHIRSDLELDWPERLLR
jgi:hypothetical protein